MNPYWKYKGGVKMISTEFKQNVESGDLVTVRSALVDYLIIDRTFKKFDEALEYACANLNIMQPYDNNPFEMESEKWDNAYLNQQKVALMVNFSEERIVHIKSIIKIVMPANVTQKTETVSNRPSISESHENRTGRTVVSEKVVDSKNANSAHNRNSQYESRKPNSTSSAPRNTGQSTTGRTGKKVVSETPSETRHSEEKSKTEDGIGTAMIVGGVAVVAVGLVTIEPIVVGTGVVIAGAGVGMKVKSSR